MVPKVAFQWWEWGGGHGWSDHFPMFYLVIYFCLCICCVYMCVCMFICCICMLACARAGREFACIWAHVYMKAQGWRWDPSSIMLLPFTEVSASTWHLCVLWRSELKSWRGWGGSLITEPSPSPPWPFWKGWLPPFEYHARNWRHSVRKHAWRGAMCLPPPRDGIFREAGKEPCVDKPLWGQFSVTRVSLATPGASPLAILFFPVGILIFFFFLFFKYFLWEWIIYSQSVLFLQSGFHPPDVHTIFPWVFRFYSKIHHHFIYHLRGEKTPAPMKLHCNALITWNFI